MKYSLNVLRVATVSGAVLALVAGFGLATTPLATADPSSQDGTDYATDVGANRLAAAVGDELASSLETRLSYGGIRITSAGIEVSIVGSPTASIDRTIQAASKVSSVERAAAEAQGDEAGSSVPVIVRSVAHSDAELQSLSATITSSFDDWAAQGVALSSWGPDVVTNTIKIDLAHYTPDAAELLTAAYGDLVTVSGDDQVAEASSRTADGAPWYGGSKITGPSGSCSTWFPATRNSDGKAVMLTAGHCGTGTWKNNGNTMGTVSFSKWDNYTDSEVIPVSSNAGYIFSDPTSTTRTVTGVSTNNPVGGLVCTEGYTDREVCSVKIYAISQTVTYDGQLVYGLVKGVQTAGKNAFSAGDSGGPVGSTTGTNKIRAYGMLIARVTSDPSQGWYMPATSVEDRMGVTVKIG